MNRKMLVVTLGAMVSIGVAFAGCKGGNTAGGTNEPAKSNAPAAAPAAAGTPQAAPQAAPTAAAEAQPAAAGGDVAQALCGKISEAMLEQMKKAASSAHGDPQKMADEMKTSCIDSFNKLPADQKEAEGKKADEALKTCADKTGEEFMKCAEPILNKK